MPEQTAAINNMDYWIVTITGFYLKRKVLWILICIHTNSVVNENKKHSQRLSIEHNEEETETHPRGLILHYMWSYTCLQVRLALQWKWKSAWRPAQFERDLSNSFTEISLVFHMTTGKCQPTDDWQTAVQLCSIFCTSAIITPSTLCCRPAGATWVRGEAG